MNLPVKMRAKTEAFAKSGKGLIFQSKGIFDSALNFTGLKKNQHVAGRIITSQSTRSAHSVYPNRLY